MIDFDRSQAQYWHADACRKAHLIGSISFHVNAVKDDTKPFPLTADQAIDYIAALLTEYDETARQHRGADR